MSENEIKKNNKLIAQFMGWTVEKNCFSKVEKYGDKLQNERGISVKNRDYHSDWNLLMQVVEKIFTYGYDIRINYFGSESSFHSDICQQDNEISNTVKEFYNGSFIKFLHENVVEFVKWYNAQSFS